MATSLFIRKIRDLFLVFFLAFSIKANAENMLDFSNASVYSFKNESRELEKVIQVLQEEIQKRSGIEVKSTKKINPNFPQIIITLEEGYKSLPETFTKALSKLNLINEEGYQLAVFPSENKVVVYAKTKRGALYGVGKLLRSMEIRNNEILVPAELTISSSPTYEIRGHQLGYRPKTNSYDAWTVAMFDQYIRDLAIFGANSIEIMPPRTDDDFTSRHMQIPAIEMIKEQSRICNEYDLDVWMWYPNMGSDYQNPDSLSVEIKERHEVFSTVPRLDHLFVPGGDPGDLEPEILFAWLEQVAEVLHQYHPNAKIWVSPQVFRPTESWLSAFFTRINRKPAWLGGVVFGPWVKTPLEDIRKIVDAEIPIRKYPDITHSLSAQYPIPKWDLGWAITLGRECINPRPNDEKMIHNALDQFANGSISYSEGTNDDVNKFIWSDQDWNPETPVIETLREYARFFISPDLAEEIAQGILALEKNIQGPLLTNEDLQNTFMQWQQIETKATAQVKGNFRFQMGLIRAYFDAYVQKRQMNETWLEQKAKDELGKYPTTSTEKAIANCKATLAKAWEEPIYVDLKLRCAQLADDLFKSIGAQLTIEKHGAMGGRGNFLDNIDNPLNDVAWIYSQLSRAEKVQNNQEKINIIEGILQRTNPGPGGFYDNFGSPSGWKRIVTHHNPKHDPGNLKTPRVSFGVGLRDTEWVHEITAKGFEGDASPMAWMNQVTTLYDLPLEILYNDMDPEGTYVIRVAYTGRFRSRMKMTADGFLVHDFIKTGQQPIYEFPIPKEAIKDGKVLFSWTCGDAERGAQVSEVWIIKK
ncbi:alpha-glucuronidase family glycosyl hydrolase [Flexithrix dorotheae]|uniref:alpha-glucuronidase family glycosyl hydrolase n=1 Tax=Flexithrix dorotheae TaxID=70993 RepID=UPI00037FEBD5|nr:alpha-glucuronidase family glycosyl hydrolase [Flexithrix dorotheae]